MPFGLHNLRLAAQVAANVPTEVIINHENGPYPTLDKFYTEQRLSVLLQGPFEYAIAEGSAQGETPVDVNIHQESGDCFHEVFMQTTSLL